jgi:cytoskeleton protein RodZ
MARGNFGERLKRERELREVPLEEITLATRIGPRFLEALENEDWDKLPGGVFNRGFVRSIARYLGLDEEAFLGEYDLAHNAHAQLVEQKHAAQKIENRIPPTPLWVPIALGLGFLLLLAGLIFGGRYAWRKYQRHSTSPNSGTVSPPAAKPVDNPTPQPLAVSAPAAESPLDLFISTSAPAQVSVQADGATVLDTSVLPGKNMHFSAKSEFVVSVDNSSAVLLELNGEAMPPIGPPGASGTIALSRKNLRQATGGNAQP